MPTRRVTQVDGCWVAAEPPAERSSAWTGLFATLAPEVARLALEGRLPASTQHSSSDAA